jgi:taurine dioxygenase
VQPRFTYRHYWSVGDLVMWDNRCMVHLAVGDYDPAEIRHMIRTSGMGDYYGRYLDPEAAAKINAPSAPATAVDKKAVASLHD